ncbi:hypothetical protein BZA05DRAFT_401660 [Tricharina praecox]|uniref:uncharacterized protein n=1 Tax=Tricharina praecox TaxID=43433 RepID=UPI00221E9661|nr:uncharacterized protein BZA05DRAFT_401660 [Tricharina praecox]KAI5849823.1 hypothetical protein BZA05DRAFT_401660 [Tricharina praecox]
MTVPSSNSNRSSSAGMHTLVAGLTLSSPSPTTPAATQTSFTAAPTSIFNNPGHGIFSTSSSPRTSSTPNKFAGRRLSYAVDAGGRGNDSAVKEVDDPTSTLSADRSHANTPSRTLAVASPQNIYGRCGSYRGSDSLEDFLYNRGFLQGACSDVTIIAFGTQYRLHRLILDRSSFFSSCFNGGPWAEADSSEITLSPEATDPNIEKHAFELALARLYGHVDKAEEDKHAMPLLATASYLRLQDLAESCVASLLRSLKTSNIADIIRFVTNSYYGPLTDRLLDSAKALLYRDGWEMQLSEWDGISGEIAAEIVGYEGFYVPTEYHRYCFVKGLTDCRIKAAYLADGSPVDGSFLKIPENPDNDYLSADMARHHDLDDGVSSLGDDEIDADIQPLRDLLETGIYYIHMSFEELQKIAEDVDILGRPFVSEATIRDALWQQTILRQKVLNAQNDSPELGISKTEYVQLSAPVKGGKSPNTLEGKSTNTVGLLTPCTSSSQLDLFTTGRGQKPKRKYFIPTEDSSTTVIGDYPEQTPHVSVSGRGQPRGGASGNNNSSNNDTTAVSTSAVANPDSGSKESGNGDEIRYSDFPPFRFSAEFKNIRCLKERKRVYSKTVFYAGSCWNIYIQSVKGARGTQLGVYLHRAKDREGSGASSAGNRENDQLIGMIGSLNQNQKSEAEEGDTTLHDGDTTGTLSSRPGANTSASRATPPPSTEVSVAALGHYVDSRPIIQTYFKIFSPSRKGKMLSIFSSRPDSFNFSQSWGWKSSSLILDEGMLGGEGNEKDSRLRFMVVLGNV